jgi:hypothetical protein
MDDTDKRVEFGMPRTGVRSWVAIVIALIVSPVGWLAGSVWAGLTLGFYHATHLKPEAKEQPE